MERLLSCLAILLLLWGLYCFDLLGCLGKGCGIMCCKIIQVNTVWISYPGIRDRSKTWRINLEDRYIFISHLQHAVIFLSAMSVRVNKHYSRLVSITNLMHNSFIL